MANILANSDVFNNNTAIYLIKRFNFNENFEPRYSLLMLIVSASRANSGHLPAVLVIELPPSKL